MVFFHRSPAFYHPLLLSTWSPSSLRDETGDGSSIATRRQSNRSGITTGKETASKDHDKTLKIRLDLPGTKPADVKVEYQNSVLTIRSKRHVGRTGTVSRTHHFQLNENTIDLTSFQASLVNGVLTITVDKKETSNTAVVIPVSSQSPPERTEEDDKLIRFSFDLPGVKANDLRLNVHDSTIVLRAKRLYVEGSRRIKKYLSIDTKRVQTDSLEAFLADGVLTINGKRKETSNTHFTIPVCNVEGSTEQPHHEIQEEPVSEAVEPSNEVLDDENKDESNAHVSPSEVGTEITNESDSAYTVVPQVEVEGLDFVVVDAKEEN